MRYPPPTQSARPPGQPLLVYDGECGFCLATACWVQRRAGGSLALLTFEEAARRGGVLDALHEDEVRRSAHFITAEGVEYHGGAAVTRALRLGRGGRAAALLDVPPLSVARDALYAVVARQRGRLGWLAGGAACSREAGRRDGAGPPGDG